MEIQIILALILQLLIHMLNPFAIEKETLNKVAGIRDTVLRLRLALSQQILQGGSQIDSRFRHELESYMTSSVVESKAYECRVCGKTFNEGRKLGGHVSRAHKGLVEGEMKSQVSQQFTPVRGGLNPKKDRLLFPDTKKGVNSSQAIFDDKGWLSLFFLLDINGIANRYEYQYSLSWMREDRKSNKTDNFICTQLTSVSKQVRVQRSSLEIQTMIVKTIELHYPWKELRYKVYEFTRAITSNTAGIRSHLIQAFLLEIILIFPFCSPLFKTPSLCPQPISNLFRIFLLTHFEQNFGMSFDNISIVVSIYMIIVLTFSASHFILQTVPVSITKSLSAMIVIVHCLMAPLTDFAVACFLTAINPQTSSGQKIMGFFTGFLVFWTLTISCLNIFFQIRVTRKRTTFWNLTNDIHAIGALFVILKTVYISLYSVSLILCLMSLGFWYLLTQQTTGSIRSAEWHVKMSLFNYLALTDASVLLSILTSNRDFAFRIWIVGLITVTSGYAIMIFRSKQRKLYLPTCDKPPEQFYDFYYSCKEQIKGEDMSDKKLGQKSLEFFHLHRFHCKREGCRLSEWLRLSDNSLQSIISTIIEAKAKQNLKNRILNQLWNIQLGRKRKTSAIMNKELTFGQEFVIYGIEKATKDNDITLSNRDSDQKEITNSFYDLIFQTSNHFCLFYQELSKAEPAVDSIVQHGIQITKKIRILKNVYADLIKRKLMNFKMIQIYIQFISRLVSEVALSKDDIVRLSKIQTTPFDDISESYLPTFAVHPESGSVQNANSEAQKFTQATRFELKNKSVKNLAKPELTIELLRMFIDADKQSTEEDSPFLFFLQNEKDYVLGSIDVSECMIKGKKLIVLQVTKNNFSSQKNAFLINQDFALLLSLYPRVKVRNGPYRNRPLMLNWTELFDRHIANNREKILRSKIVKIHMDYSSYIIIVRRLRCAVPNHFILQTEVFFNDQPQRMNKKTSHSVFSLSNSTGGNPGNKKFEFIYDQNQEGRSILKGMRGHAPTHHRESFEIPNFLKQNLGGLHTEKVGQQLPEYGKEIKTYRLYQGDLYNIDLEAREAYYDSFEGKSTEGQKVEIQKNSSFECYFMIGVVALVFVLIGLSVFLILQFKASTTFFSFNWRKHSNVQNLLIDFNRIVGLVRDLSSGFSLKFPNISMKGEIEESYYRIQTLRNLPLFDSHQQYTIEFAGLEIVGTMIELLDVMFAHINELLNNGDMSLVPSIQSTCLELIDKMEGVQDSLLAQVHEQVQRMNFYKGLGFYSSLATIFILFSLIVYFCYRSHLKIANNLSPLLFVSDSDANIISENASKIKYAVQMIRKNYEGNALDLLMGTPANKRRKHPKKVSLSTELIIFAVFLAITALVVHVGCLTFFDLSSNNSLELFSKMKRSSLALSEAYLQQSEIANTVSIKGRIAPLDVEEIDEIIHYLTFHMNSFEFSPSLNALIHTLFFQNSCTILSERYNVSSEQCRMTTPEFTMKNPFQIGLITYFNRQNYYFLNNLTELFAHTSIHSDIFTQIMTNLTSTLNEEIIVVIDSTRTTVEQTSYIIISLDIAYFLAFLLLHSYFRGQVASIRVIVEFLRQKLLKTKIEGEEKEEDIDEDQSSNDDVESEEELLEEKKKAPQRNRFRKRTTIENNLPLLDLQRNDG